LAVQETVALPEPPLIVPGERAPQVSPDGTVLLSVTAPVKRLRLVIMTVEVPGVPAFTMTLVGLAVIAKSTTWTLTVVLRDREPLVAITVAV
jgi:hypothetical protein